MNQGRLHLGNLRPAPGAKHRPKRVGCGPGSGHGKTSTRGTKGQLSRSGDGRTPGFEGGQNPLLRRIPKRGFSNAAFRRRFQVVSLDLLERSAREGDLVSAELLRRAGMVRRDLPIKIVGVGKLRKKITVRLPAASRSARRAIEAAKGTFEVAG